MNRSQLYFVPWFSRSTNQSVIHNFPLSHGLHVINQSTNQSISHNFPLSHGSMDLSTNQPVTTFLCPMVQWINQSINQSVTNFLCPRVQWINQPTSQSVTTSLCPMVQWINLSTNLSISQNFPLSHSSVDQSINHPISQSVITFLCPMVQWINQSTNQSDTTFLCPMVQSINQSVNQSQLSFGLNNACITNIHVCLTLVSIPKSGRRKACSSFDLFVWACSSCIIVFFYFLELWIPYIGPSLTNAAPVLSMNWLLLCTLNQTLN